MDGMRAGASARAHWRVPTHGRVQRAERARVRMRSGTRAAAPRRRRRQGGTASVADAERGRVQQAGWDAGRCGCALCVCAARACARAACVRACGRMCVRYARAAWPGACAVRVRGLWRTRMLSRARGRGRARRSQARASVQARARVRARAVSFCMHVCAKDCSEARLCDNEMSRHIHI